MLSVVLIVGGMTAIAGSFLRQMLAEKDDMEEYAELLEMAQRPADGEEIAQPEMTDSLKPISVQAYTIAEDAIEGREAAPPESSATPDNPEQTPEETLTMRTGEMTPVNLSACKAQNSDFIAWLRIPGTGIDYPVVWSDDSEYYLHHTFAGKKSSVGTLFSLCRTDYAVPSQNIAIYGHHLRTNNMFTPLLSYKKESFWRAHDTVTLDSLYRSGTYRIFAALNMNIRDWEPSIADFPNDEVFMAFVNRARTLAFYETGVDVTDADEILTLITCDRSYAGADGRMVVMAVKQ